MNGQHGNNNQTSVFSGASRLLAKVCAFAAVFFLLPLFHSATVGGIESFTADRYGETYVMFANIGWLFLSGFFIFAVTQILITTFLKMVEMFLADRF